MGPLWNVSRVWGSCRIKDTLATSDYFSFVVFQDSCDLLARPLGRAMTVPEVSPTVKPPDQGGFEYGWFWDPRLYAAGGQAALVLAHLPFLK